MAYKSSTIHKTKVPPTTPKKIGYELLISLLIGIAIGTAVSLFLQPSASDLIRLIN